MNTAAALKPDAISSLIGNISDGLLCIPSANDNEGETIPATRPLGAISVSFIHSCPFVLKSNYVSCNPDSNMISTTTESKAESKSRGPALLLQV